MLAIFRGVASGSRDVYKCEKLQLLFEQLALSRLTFDHESVFLDIGSGIGKVVIQVAMEAGCVAGGIEAAESRLMLSRQFLQRLLDEEAVPAELKARVKFVHADGGAGPGPLLVDGRHATHIFMNSVVFSNASLAAISRRLNATRFRVLMCHVTEGQLADCFQLDDVHQLGPFEANRLIGGKSKFVPKVFVKAPVGAGSRNSR